MTPSCVCHNGVAVEASTQQHPANSRWQTYDSNSRVERHSGMTHLISLSERESSPTNQSRPPQVSPLPPPLPPYCGGHRFGCHSGPLSDCHLHTDDLMVKVDENEVGQENVTGVVLVDLFSPSPFLGPTTDRPPGGYVIGFGNSPERPRHDCPMTARKSVCSVADWRCNSTRTS